MSVSSSPSLFESPVFRISTLSHQIKFALKKAVSESKFSREEIVEKVNKLANDAAISLTKGNGALSLDLFAKWLNVNEPQYKPNIEAITAIYFVLNGNLNILEPIIRAWNVTIINSEDAYYRDLGKLQCEMKDLRRKQKALEVGR